MSLQQPPGKALQSPTVLQAREQNELLVPLTLMQISEPRVWLQYRGV